MLQQIYTKNMNYKLMRSECISLSRKIYFNSRFKAYIKSNLKLKETSHSILKSCLKNGNKYFKKLNFYKLI